MQSLEKKGPKYNRREKKRKQTEEGKERNKGDDKQCPIVENRKACQGDRWDGGEVTRETGLGESQNRCVGKRLPVAVFSGKKKNLRQLGGEGYGS